MANIRSRFKPHDPDSVRARFERVKTQALRKLDEEAMRLQKPLKAVERVADRQDEDDAPGEGQSHERRGP